MNNYRHVLRGCGLASAIMLGVFVVGLIVLTRSFLGNLPFLQTEADRAQQQVQADQIRRDAQLQQPWDPIVTGAREIMIVSVCLAVPVTLMLVGARSYRNSRWVWPRDGMWPMLGREVREKTDIAIRSVEARNRAEEAHAGRALPPVHMHVTGKATKETEPDVIDMPTAEAPSFEELLRRGEFEEKA